MGRNSVFQDGFGTTVTNDGVSICRQINPENGFEAIGADLIKQASEKTNEEAGDGTTTSIVLAHAIIEEGLKELATGESPIVIKKKLEEAQEVAIAQLKGLAKEISDDSDVLSVAKISVEDDHIADVVSSAMKRAGKNGAVIVEYGMGYNVEKEEVDGYFWDKGYVSPYMATNEKMEATMENPMVILTDKNLNLNSELVEIMNSIISTGNKNVLLVSDNVEGELLATLIVNKMKNIINVVAVRRPHTIEELEDLAIMTGATAVTKEKDIRKFDMSHIGHAIKVIVKKDNTTVIGQETQALKDRIQELRTQLDLDKDNEKLKERLAKLANGIVVLKVGAKTESDREYLKLKVDDAVGACRAALEEGVVVGGGVTLRDIGEKSSYEPFKRALRRPYTKILENAGIVDDGKNYNVKTGLVVKDLIKEGIIDPAKVTRCVIENAVSLAKTFLTIESAIVEIEQPQESAQKGKNHF